MKKLVYLSILIISLQSCIKTVPLKGKYQEKPVKTIFNQPFNIVWDSVIDYISDNGHDVQLIDKESGIIISEVLIANGYQMSHEDKKGVLINDKAYLAVDRTSNDFPKGALPMHRADTKWTLRVKSISADKTEVSTLLHVKRVGIGAGKMDAYYFGISTGNYEKKTLDDLIDRLRK